ncbi:Vacuolar protein-sorting-associated protein 60 [Hypoxylon texense]
MASKLCQLGRNGSKYVSASSLINETDIWEGLNAFNLNHGLSMDGCWAFISKWITNIPSNEARDVADFADWEADSRINTYARTGLLNDLNRVWSPVGEGLPREANSARYRWIIFMHRHNAPDRSYRLSPQTIYSCTVWDRETETATWYDCWPYGSEARSRDIRTYWQYIPNRWPAVVINALRDHTARTISNANVVESHVHAELIPAYSQLTMISVILWHIRNVDVSSGSVEDPAPIYPLIESGLTSGMSSTLLPRLIVNLLLMLRVNGDTMRNLNRDGRGVREEIRNRFYIPNRNLRLQVRRILVQETADTEDSLVPDLITPPPA